MVDLWSYQRKEIESAHLDPGEDEALQTEKRVLANAEKLYAAAIGGFEQLYEGSASAEVSLRAALRNVEELARYDARFQEAAQQLQSARATVDDIATSLRDYAEGINASPDRLADIEDRLALIDRLKRKYGQTIPEVIAFGEDVSRKLAEVEDRDEILKQLGAELAAAAAAYRAAASALSAERKSAAARLAKLAEAQINSLAMKVRFEISVHSAQEGTTLKERMELDAAGALKGHVPQNSEALKGHGFSRATSDTKKEGALAPEGMGDSQSHWTSTGWDEVHYRISTNPGEPLKPLDEIASGGEMSRVMLALKVAVEESSSKTRKKNPTPRTLVFDEIDIGIGGRAAEAVGQKLKSLARAQQVLCVTHLPQIAAFADQHLAVEKHESQGRTQTQIRTLDDQARTQEVARMLSGATVTETSLQHAAQMIAASR
jgi:DNA repair protein RecN (Recombination protein N)